jgi:ureidoacrylate peracid hydrolase
MHPSDIPQAILDRIAERRGRVHAFETIESRKTALVVVDMQNAFCAAGAAGEVPLAKKLSPNINRLARETRAAGGLVVWVQSAIRKIEDWPVFLDTLLKPQLAQHYVSDLTPGSEGHKLWPELEPEPNDLYVAKNRFSAFLPTACDLPSILRERGLDTVLIVGTLTNVCCESSARDAAMQDFKTVLVSDGNATRSDEDHLATLRTFLAVFGDVRTTDETIALLRAGRPTMMSAAE